MTRLNLNDNVSSVFGFTISGLDFDLHYPSLAQMKPAQELIKRQQKLENDTSPKAQVELEAINEQMEKLVYGFIKPVGHEKPIKEVLENCPLPVIKAFNNMLLEQLNGK